MHTLLNKEFRPVAANEILSSEHFPEDMQQDFLICNTIGFLGVKQYDLDRDGDGQKRPFGHVWGTPVKELINSGDRNFRATDAIIGEDGALYVADWHNVIIGHMQHNIRDPNRDHKHGRILRLTVKDRPLQKPVKIHGQPIAALLENLKHQSRRHRRLLARDVVLRRNRTGTLNPTRHPGALPGLHDPASFPNILARNDFPPVTQA